MAAKLFLKGKEGFGDGTVDWDTNTIKIGLFDLNTADAGIKAVTGATNATPIVLTVTAHGFANGDWVVVGGVGGNLAANGLWKVANQTTNTFELTDPITGANVVGSGAYTSGGYAVCIGPSAAGDNLDDFSAALVGTAQTLTSTTITNGIADAADPSFPSVTGNSAEALMIWKDTGVESTSRMIYFYDGQQIVTVAAAVSASATSIPVERLQGGIPNGTVLTFSNGQSATLTAAANAGDRTLTVSALASGLSAGNRATAPITSSGLPVTPNGGNINVTFDNGAYKIFEL